MPVGPSPRAAPPIRFESIAISTSYLNMSTLNSPPKADRGRRVISLTIGGFFRLALQLS